MRGEQSSLWQGHSPRCTRQRADTVGGQALQAGDFNAKGKMTTSAASMVSVHGAILHSRSHLNVQCRHQLRNCTCCLFFRGHVQALPGAALSGGMCHTAAPGIFSMWVCKPAQQSPAAEVHVHAGHAPVTVALAGATGPWQRGVYAAGSTPARPPFANSACLMLNLACHGSQSRATAALNARSPTQADLCWVRSLQAVIFCRQQSRGMQAAV